MLPTSLRHSAEALYLNEVLGRLVESEERSARDSLAEAQQLRVIQHIRRFSAELTYLIDKELAVLQLTERENRRRIEEIYTHHHESLWNFFLHKTSSTARVLSVSVFSAQREGAAWIWLFEALYRRELEVRFTLQTIFLQHHLELAGRLHRPYVAVEDRTVSGLPSIPDVIAARQAATIERIWEELQRMHHASRIRIEWSEELEWSRIVSIVR